MSARRRFLGLSLSGLALIGIYSCNAPYIPVPPPASPTFAAITVSDGMGGTKRVWETQGPAVPAAANAKVYVYNASIETGVIAKARADGSYLADPIDGQPGDQIQISYETPQREASPILCRLLVEGLATENCP